MEEEDEFKRLIAEMRRHRMAAPAERVHIRIPDAGSVLMELMSRFIALEGRRAVWLKEYDKVAEWLSDNRGQGLLLCGNCGNGKSVLSRLVIPAILLKYEKRVVSVYDAQKMNSQIDEVMDRRLLSLDDIGTEGESVEYGNRRMAFPEIVDMAEKKGKLLIVSSNLRGRELKERYGERLLDRIISTMRVVEFNGKSMR
jgi:DNA replication protein DnaC